MKLLTLSPGKRRGTRVYTFDLAGLLASVGIQQLEVFKQKLSPKVLYRIGTIYIKNQDETCEGKKAPVSQGLEFIAFLAGTFHEVQVENASETFKSGR
jgi:hypothetical protein